MVRLLPLATIFGPDMDRQASFRDVAAADVAEALGRWRAECDPRPTRGR